MKATRTKEICLGQFLEGLNQASGGARHMLHHHQDSRWFNIIAILEAIHSLCVAQAVDPMLLPKPKPEKTSVII